MKHFPGSWFRVVTTIFQNPLALVGGVLLSLSPIASRGQSVTFAGVQSVLPTNGLDAATGVAVDSSGNVVISDFYNQRAVVLSKTPTGYAPQANLPTSGLSGIYGIAVDVAGDVFIPDGFNDRIVELPKTATGYGPQITLPGTTIGGGGQVALDIAGDVFFTAAYPVYNNVGELPWTGMGYGPRTILTTDLSSPNNLAVDAAGDVFVMDSGNNRVVELRRTSSGYAPQTTLPFSGLNELDGGGIAVDSTGSEVIVTDTDNNRILEEQMTATGWGPQTTLLTGLNFPRGLFLDSAGDVFIADQNNNRVLELQTVSVNFDGAHVCAPGATTPAPCSQTLTLTYNVNADTTLGEPQVATGGLKYLDFNRASGTTCIGAVTAGATCTVKVSFAPLAAGFRHGSVSLPSGGHDITTTQLSGFGIEATTGAPVAQLSTSKLSFGAIDFGAPKTFPLFVANIGGGTLTVAPSISGPSYKIADSTCAAGVTPGNSCTLVVEYSPVSIGPHDDTLTVATNGGSPTVGLFGSVVGLSVLGGVSGATLEFGTVSSGSTEVELLTVTNVGLPGTVTVGTAISGLTFSILTTAQNTCMAGIAAGQSCTLPVQFAPTHSGPHDEPLTLTPFPGSGNTKVWLTGSTP